MWSYERSVHVMSYLFIRGGEMVGLWNNEDEITDNLHLSSLPMRGNEEDLIKKVNAPDSNSMLVVSAVDPYENNETLLFMDPVRPEEWKKTFKIDESEVKVEHVQLVMRDFSSGKEIDVKSAAEIVLKIQQFRDAGHSVLVHCKAGRTRSAMLVACVLAVYDLGKLPENATKSPEELIDLAVKFIEVKRPQIKVHKDVKQTAVKIVNMVRNILRGVEKPEEPFNIKLDRLAINPIVKLAVQNERSYEQLRNYCDKAINKTGQLLSKFKPIKRVEYVDRFMKSVESIDDLNDGSWLTHLMCGSGPVGEFLDADPYAYFVGDKDEDKKERARLIDNLKNSVEILFIDNLGCSKEELNANFSPEHKPALVGNL